jgi:hypothetical protein
MSVVKMLPPTRVGTVRYAAGQFRNPSQLRRPLLFVLGVAVVGFSVRLALIARIKADHEALTAAKDAALSATLQGIARRARPVDYDRVWAAVEAAERAAAVGARDSA